MRRLVAAALAVSCLAGSPANADPERYQRYWKEAKDYAARGFAEADKALAAMKTDHEEYCYRLAMTRTELERSTKLFMYAFEQIDADSTLTEAEASKLEPMIDDYKAIKSIADRYIGLQETRCLSGPSYSDTIPSQSHPADASEDEDWAGDEDEEDNWDDHDASEDDNF